MVPLHHAIQACTLARLGRFDDAREHFDLVMDQLHSGSERYLWPECERLLGDYYLLCPGDRSADAEAAYTRALDIATEQRAVIWQLCAALSLARFWSTRGEEQRAREMLNRHVGLFKEPPDMAAYQEAVELLVKLG